MQINIRAFLDTTYQYVICPTLKVLPAITYTIVYTGVDVGFQLGFYEMDRNSKSPILPQYDSSTDFMKVAALAACIPSPIIYSIVRYCAESGGWSFRDESDHGWLWFFSSVINWPIQLLTYPISLMAFDVKVTASTVFLPSLVGGTFTTAAMIPISGAVAFYVECLNHMISQFRAPQQEQSLYQPQPYSQPQDQPPPQPRFLDLQPLNSDTYIKKLVEENQITTAFKVAREVFKTQNDVFYVLAKALEPRDPEKALLAINEIDVNNQKFGQAQYIKGNILMSQLNNLPIEEDGDLEYSQNKNRQEQLIQIYQAYFNAQKMGVEGTDRLLAIVADMISGHNGFLQSYDIQRINEQENANHILTLLLDLRKEKDKNQQLTERVASLEELAQKNSANLDLEEQKSFERQRL